MRNRFKRKWKNNLSATFKTAIYKDLGTDTDCCTLDEALDLIEKKNNYVEAVVKSGTGRKPNRQALLGLSKGMACTKGSKKKLELKKLSIQIDKEY